MKAKDQLRAIFSKDTLKKHQSARANSIPVCWRWLERPRRFAYLDEAPNARRAPPKRNVPWHETRTTHRLNDRKAARRPSPNQYPRRSNFDAVNFDQAKELAPTPASAQVLSEFELVATRNHLLHRRVHHPCKAPRRIPRCVHAWLRMAHQAPQPKACPAMSAKPTWPRALPMP